MGRKKHKHNRQRPDPGPRPHPQELPDLSRRSKPPAAPAVSAQPADAGEPPIEDVIFAALRRQANQQGLTVDDDLLRRAAREPRKVAAQIRACFGTEPLALVGFDTPGIQTYLLKVRRPVDLFGGSWLVQAFTDKNPQEPFPDRPLQVSLYQHLHDGALAIPAEAVIYAGGGGGLLLLAAFEEEPVAKRLREILNHHTAGDLETVATVLPIWPEDLDRESLSRRVSEHQLPRALKLAPQASSYASTLEVLKRQQARDRSATEQLAPGIPQEQYLNRCRACGTRVGTDRRPQSDPAERDPICAGCEFRRDLGARLKEELEQVKDFAELVGGWEKPQLAVIYADGANVGQAFAAVRSLEEHRELSRAVDRAMEDARKVAIQRIQDRSQHLPAGPEDAGPLRERYQTLLAGGDDLVLVLPAALAPEVIPLLCNTFSARFSPARKFALGIGLAVADAHFPIQFTFRYAKELLKSAKERLSDAFQQDQRPGGAVDFLVLRTGTPLSEDLLRWRERHHVRPAGGSEPTLWLTRRPYLLPEFEELVRCARLLHQHVSSSQLELIGRELRANVDGCRNLWRYQHARAADGEGWAKFREELKCALSDVDRLLLSQDPRQPERMSTNFLDALDLVDLLQDQSTPAVDPTGSTPTPIPQESTHE